MTSQTAVKICGLRSVEDVSAVAQAGARYAGLNFFKKSPRYVSIQTARELALAAPPGLAKVALVVNAGDDLLDDITKHVPLDMLQLHGHETPERVAIIRARYGLPVMKVVGIAESEDTEQLSIFEEVADQILVDAKPPRTSVLPGGNGLAFDWRLIAGRTWARPWRATGPTRSRRSKSRQLSPGHARRGGS